MESATLTVTARLTLMTLLYLPINGLIATRSGERARSAAGDMYIVNVWKKLPCEVLSEPCGDWLGNIEKKGVKKVTLLKTIFKKEELSMKNILLIIVAVCVTAGLANAGYPMTNTSFESYADDGYGRIMPTDYGLWTDGGNWGNVGACHVVTTDAHAGSASMQIGTLGSDVALTYGLGILGNGVYQISGYVKGAGASGIIGVDMFAPDWSNWWWGGGASVSPATADAWTKFNFEITVSTPAQWNFVVKGYAGTADFLVDDVAVTPEPATLGLLALGGLLLRKRK
jgi:hypothetical protein